MVISDQALLGAEQAAAVVAGYGSVPSAIAQKMILDAVTDERSRATLRRLYAAPPSTGALVALESRSRLFPRGLADFIEFRDQRCRTPYCDAPVRHHDHARPHRRGGRTSSVNGQGGCVKPATTRRNRPAGMRPRRSMKAAATQPNLSRRPGAHYHSTAPPMPGTPRMPMTAAEIYLNGALLQVIAA